MNTVSFVLMIVFAILGYQVAESHAKKTGHRPWGWPSWAWAIAWGFSLIIGAILWVIASRTSKAPMSAPLAAQAPAQAFASSSVFGTPAAAVPATQQQPPAGWYPDAHTGGQRYWDGAAWTEQTTR